MHIKGQELPMHDPRGSRVWALSYATSPTGANHIEAPHDTSFLTDARCLKAAKPAGVLEPVQPWSWGPEKFVSCSHPGHLNSFNSMGVCNFAAARTQLFLLDCWPRR